MAYRLGKLPPSFGGNILTRTQQRMMEALRVVTGGKQSADNDQDVAPVLPDRAAVAVDSPTESAAVEAPTTRRRLARGTAVGSHDSDTQSRIAARMEHDMRLARTIQQRFLPAVPAMHNGVRMHATYCPAYEIGGDFYDLIEIDRYRFQVIIGDVSGKGVAAALVMSRIISEFRRAAQCGLGPAEVLDDVNRFLFDHDLPDGFVTATCVEVDLKSRAMRVANAGHVPTLARRKLTGATWMFGEASGAPLGLLETETYACETFYFEPGDIIVMVTDGVTEALEPCADPAAGVLLGIVADCDHDIEQVSRNIVGAVNASEQPHTLDDVALFAMQLA